ncbi:ferric uptake regulator family protein (plasmid) [Burkholderia glumae]|uniref:hypothetical protein n=1 Tax=Burkholderia glumae TaxID=337 RepID=UPI00036F2E61|nr:hypothetical protein [Burkholderia glumae]PJO20245.1 ferric uptake regulator family protein [Burkholderia glumae AU6208]NVE26179.1 ferric uptake regulator family protein [Burkholderia glumae]PNK93186.1 ferric uptake regulator family protein [Burkholderia glumae]QHP95023.1 ferric uptake regulator family protein [Burkholderia glumae]RQZ65651.1 ferric uptake regulator family protein [Burkholderia glumae]
MLVRTEGAQGRALYALKPDRKDVQNDIMHCHCGAWLIFSEDRVLLEHLRSQASQEGFYLDEEPAFTVTVTCPECLMSQGRRG